MAEGAGCSVTQHTVTVGLLRDLVFCLCCFLGGGGGESSGDVVDVVFNPYTLHFASV